jgi:hypothetical protein
MELVIGLSLIAAGLATYAWVCARPLSMLLAFLGGAVPTLLGNAVLAQAGYLDGARLWIFTICWGALLVVVHQTATVVRGVRTTADGLIAAPVEVASPRDELRRLAESMQGPAGFVLVPEGVVQVGDNHLAVLVHSDGTRVEIIQGDGIPAGYACATEMSSGRAVVSVPWSHGIDEGRIRVPGATLPELLEHHHAEVARRVAGGDRVCPIAVGDALAIVMLSDQDEAAAVLAAPWRHSLQIALQQGPLRALVGR